MPLQCLHMTTLEITHSLTAPEIEALVHTILPKSEEITNYTRSHQARLVKPMLSYDASAIAISFLPAAGEGTGDHNDTYTYHHLRRDVYNLSSSTGVEITSRYTVPSSHLTIARFIEKNSFVRKEGENLVHDPAKLRTFIDKIEGVNEWLKASYWPKDGRTVPAGGEWIVGQEQGFDFRKGTLWYGGGETIRLGKGF